MLSKTIISETTIWTIRGSRDIREGLMSLLGISKPTLFKYLRENNPALTQEDVVNFLINKSGLGRDQLLEKVSLEEVPVGTK